MIPKAVFRRLLSGLIRNEFLMNFMHYFVEDDTALFIQPVVEKVLFSVIIVGTSYMNVNIYTVGIHILLCIFDNAYPHILSEKCNIFSAYILHFSFRYLIAFKSINSISDIPALADNKRICYILGNILRCRNKNTSVMTYSEIYVFDILRSKMYSISPHSVFTFLVSVDSTFIKTS